jgi:hypothetical protein
MRTLRWLTLAICLLALTGALVADPPPSSDGHGVPRLYAVGPPDALGSLAQECAVPASVPVIAPTGEALQAVLHGGEVDPAGVLRGAGVALRDASGATLWDDFRREWNPWLLRVGRFSGREVLLVGVRNTAPMDPVERPRPFLFTVRANGLGLQKAWLGTSLSRPFRTADFGNIDDAGEDELVALEWTAAGEPAVRAYRWRGFGIEGIADAPPITGADDLLCGDVLGDQRAEVVVRIVEGERWRFLALGLEGEGLVVVGEVRATVGPQPARWALQTTGKARGVVLARDSVRRMLAFGTSR